jgi:hypothetical protein
MDPSIIAMKIKVVPAFLLRGSRKAVMPFEMASTPVTDAVPLAKAFKIKNKLKACGSARMVNYGGLVTRPSEPEK